MAATQGSLKVWFYTTPDGAAVLPCLVTQGYSAYTSKTVNTKTTTEGSITFADVLVLGYDEVKLYGVAVGTTNGTIAVGN